MAAATIANMTTLLLACDAMFKNHMPSGVRVTSFEVKDGKILNWFHDEKGVLKSQTVTFKGSLKPVDLRIQIYKEEQMIRVGGDVMTDDGQHCAVTGHESIIKLVSQPEKVCRSPGEKDARHVRLGDNIYTLTFDFDDAYYKFSLFYDNPDVSIIRSVGYDTHIGIEGEKAEWFVFKKNGKCQRVETATFKEGWPLRECDTTPIKLESSNKTTINRLYHLRYLLTVFDCDANGTSELSHSFIDNTYVKFLLDPDEDVKAAEEEGSGWWTIGGCIVGGIIVVLVIVGVVLLIVCLKNRKAKKQNKDSSLRTAVPLYEPPEGLPKPSNMDDRVDVTNASFLYLERTRKKPEEYYEDPVLKIRVPKLIQRQSVHIMVDGFSPIHRGKFTVIYLYDSPGETNRKAVKFTAIKNNAEAEERAMVEIAVMRQLLFGINPSLKNRLPIMVDAGRSKEFYYFVTPMMGPSLEEVMMKHKSKLDNETCLKIMYQIWYTLRAFEALGFCHGDVKPGHLLSQVDTVYPTFTLTDLALTRSYATPRDSPFTGSFKYAPIGIHDAKPTAPVDDFQSWLIISFELFEPLPWGGEKDPTKIKEKKLAWTGALQKDHAKLGEHFANLKNLLFSKKPEDKLDTQKLFVELRIASRLYGQVDLPGPWFIP